MFLKKIAYFLKHLIDPPTWQTLSNEEREQLLSMSARQRRKLAWSMANTRVVLGKQGALYGEVGSGNTSNATGNSDDGGIALGNILADMRREAIRAAITEGKRNGK